MEKKEGDFKLRFSVQDKACFNSNTHINIESTDVKEILKSFIQSLRRLVSIRRMVVGGTLKK